MCDSAKPPTRVAILANPMAGGGRGKRRAVEIQTALRDEGIRAPVHWTAAPGHAETLARHLGGEEADLIVVCGGDGTIHETVNGMDLGGPALAVAQAGRGNDLARVLGMPRDAAGFARVVATGRRRWIDLGQATGADDRRRRFCTVAALGFDAEVARRVLAGGPGGGSWVYLYGILRSLVSYRSRLVRVEGEFGALEERVFLAATANTSMYGGGVRIAPQAAVDDGLLTLCLVRPVSRLMVITLYRRVRAGLHIGHPAVAVRQGRSIRITSPEPIDLYADGEPLATTPVTLDVLPRSLQVIAR